MSQTKAQLIDPVDGSLVNADINASAAIAGTKISPDFGSQNIATTGNVSIGGTNLNMATAYIDFSGSISTPSTAAAIYRPADNQLAFSTANTERVKITNSGLDVTGAITGTGNLTIDTNTLHVDSSNNRVGIGTTSPANNLHLGASGADQKRSIKIDGTNGSSELQSVILESDSENAKFNIKMGIGGGTPASKLTLNSSGNVGIGTESPGRQLEVNADSANTFIRIRSSDTGNAGFEFGDQSAPVQGAIFQNSSDNSLRFNGFNNAERMRIDSSGRFLIAKGTPDTTTSQIQIGNNTTGYSWDVGDTPQVLIAGVNNESPTSGTLNIAVRVTDENANNMFQIHNRGGGNTDVGEVYIAGKLGVGTTSPGQLIHIHAGSSSGSLQVQSNGSNNYFAAVQSDNNFITGATSGSLAIRSGSGIFFSANDGSGVQAKIDSNGLTGMEVENWHQAIIKINSSGTQTYVQNGFQSPSIHWFDDGDRTVHGWQVHSRHSSYRRVGFWYGESGNASGNVWDLDFEVNAAASNQGYTQNQTSFTVTLGTFSNGKMKFKDITSSWPSHSAGQFLNINITSDELIGGTAVLYNGMVVTEYTSV